jgi:hypothetical protein
MHPNTANRLGFIQRPRRRGKVDVRTVGSLPSWPSPAAFLFFINSAFSAVNKPFAILSRAAPMSRSIESTTQPFCSSLTPHFLDYLFFRNRFGGLLQLPMKIRGGFTQIFNCPSLRPPRLCANQSGSRNPTRPQPKLWMPPSRLTLNSAQAC